MMISIWMNWSDIVKLDLALTKMIQRFYLSKNFTSHAYFIYYFRYSNFLFYSNKDKDMRDRDYSYLEYMRKAVEKSDPLCSKCRNKCMSQLSACDKPKCRTKRHYWKLLQTSQLERDCFVGSLKEIKHLIHIDKKPNFNLKSARLEIYKISITFPFFNTWFGNQLLEGCEGLSGLDNISQ